MKMLTIFVLTFSLVEFIASLAILAGTLVPTRTMTGIAVNAGMMVFIIVWAVIVLMSERK